MKDVWTGKGSRGQSTIEMLIALMVLILSLTTVITVSFGSQSISLDTQTNGEALEKARSVLEDARAAARKDFAALVSVSSTDDIYRKDLLVQDAAACKKTVTSRATWKTEVLRPQIIELTSQFTDITGVFAMGGDCDLDSPTGGWTAPASFLSRDLDYHAAYGDNPSINSSAGNQATGLDVLNKMIYISAGVGAPSAKDDFFILDGSSTLSGIIPPIVGSLNTGPGLNAADVERDNTTGQTYAYVVSNDNHSQLQVINVSNPASPALLTSSTLPNIISTCSPPSKPCLAGQSIFYYKGRVYIGTNYIANLALPPSNNNEFHVFCVSDPSVFGCSPSTPVWLGSANVNHNVNAIVVRDHYAYLATSDDVGELTIVDLDHLTSPAVKFDAPGGEDGMSLYVVGNRLYLGRQQTPAARRDFYAIDITSSTAPTELGSVNLGLHSGTEVTGIRANGKYVFLALSDSTIGFKVLDIFNLPAISFVSTFNFSQKTSGIDFESGFTYTANASNDALRIIRPAQCADQIDDDGDGKIDSIDPQCHTDANANNAQSYNPEDDNE